MLPSHAAVLVAAARGGGGAAVRRRGGARSAQRWGEGAVLITGVAGGRGVAAKRATPRASVYTSVASGRRGLSGGHAQRGARLRVRKHDGQVGLLGRRA